LAIAAQIYRRLCKIGSVDPIRRRPHKFPAHTVKERRIPA
jgi:hypothetical protein